MAEFRVAITIITFNNDLLASTMCSEGFVKIMKVNETRF